MTNEDEDGLTEQQWMDFIGYPTALFDLIPNSMRTVRKFVLYACACCQRVQNLFPSDEIRTVIDWGSDQADHLNKVTSTDRAGNEVLFFRDLEDIVYNWSGSEDTVPFCLTWAAHWLSYMVWTSNDGHQHLEIPDWIARAVWLQNYGKPEPVSDAFSKNSRFGGEYYTELPPAVQEERDAQCVVLRDIFGNPFRPVIINPSQLTSTVLALANGIYVEKAFDRMPILADVLQDAGCDSKDILNHCREQKEHVKGCWVVDLLTGRK